MIPMQTSQYRYPYEPTPYAVLERLANSGPDPERRYAVRLWMRQGKGGLLSFLSDTLSQHRWRYDPRIYETAAENQKTCRIRRQDRSLFWRTAGEAPVPGAVNRAYFSIRFSVELLQKVIRRILDSWYEVSRRFWLFFYYPSDEYLHVSDDRGRAGVCG